MQKNNTFHSHFIKLVLFLLTAAPLHALEVGDIVENVQIRDAHNKPMYIPALGKKMLLIFYPDPDNPSHNKEIGDAMKKTNFGLKHFMCMGIVNLKDAPLYPDWLLRIVIRRELASHDKAVIYTDPNHILKKAWNLGDCNNRFLVLLIDENRRVLLFKRTKMTQKEIKWVIKTIAAHVNTSETKDKEKARTAVTR